MCPVPKELKPLYLYSSFFLELKHIDHISLLFIHSFTGKVFADLP